MIAQRKKQYITNDDGKRVAVVLDIKTWKKMQDEIDDYYCRHAYEKSKSTTNAEVKRGEFVTIEHVIAQRRRRRGR